jgi:dihydropteroate synthase
VAKDNIFCKMKSINLSGDLIFLDEPIIMGILNLTPDSFYHGGKHHIQSSAIKQTELMLNQGATIIDVGAYSSRPNAKNISSEEELERLIPTLKMLKKTFPSAYFSVDTFRSEVADIAIQEGAAMINDISGGNLDEKIIDIIEKYRIGYVLMHMNGTPQTMQNLISEGDLLHEIQYFFSEKIQILHQRGVTDIILDPGFGFGKSLEQNYLLLENLDKFRFFNKPILVGVSRKSMIYKLLNETPEDALNGTTVLHTLAVLKNADILRVHDVKEAKEVIKMVGKLKKAVLL